MITSPQNQRVKDAVRLRQGRHRNKQGRILIDGVRELSRAITAGLQMVEIFVCEKLCTSDEERALLATLPECGAEMLKVSPQVFEKLAFGDRAEGVLGVAETPRPTLDDIRLPEDALVVVLERVEKPGNLGAVLRSADGAGASAVIVADAATDLFNPNTIRASLGTVFCVPVCAAESAEVLAWLRQHKLSMIAARVNGSMPYTEGDYRGRTAFILGSEAEGLSDTWIGQDITAVCLPMLGAADSLNVSATAAVLCYEALRQRGQNG